MLPDAETWEQLEIYLNERGAVPKTLDAARYVWGAVRERAPRQVGRTLHHRPTTRQRAWEANHVMDTWAVVRDIVGVAVVAAAIRHRSISQMRSGMPPLSLA